jgi:hypothetical protein
MSNLATYLQVGDMVSLEGDSVFDPSCEQFCPHRSQNAELTDVEADGDLLRMTFSNNEDSFTESVPATHRFNEAE